MPDRKRNMQMRFYVAEDERELIEGKMKPPPTQRCGAYLRKVAIDGYVTHTDTANIKELTSELQGIGRSVNQIAKRLNAGAPIYEADIAEIRERLNQTRLLQRHILSNLR